jgi:DNA-directed RNA polymerase subunit M/transcription elongation factor TFIIS
MSIQFCKRCDNKYYHKINNNSLVYYCRVCGYEDTDSISNEAMCVLNTQFQKGANQDFDHVVNRYTKYDPTLPKIMIKCPNDDCKTNESKKEDATTEAIYLRYDNVNLKYLYICTVCETKWTNNK